MKDQLSPGKLAKENPKTKLFQLNFERLVRNLNRVGNDEPPRRPRWYFGGISSMLASAICHPLDLLKVHLQTQEDFKLSLYQAGRSVVKLHGVLGLYTGISGSMLRQATYSTTRFGLYEVIKQQHPPDGFMAKVLIASFAGACGGFVGTPGDMINVRMQNDIKLPLDKKRNYKNALDGLMRVYMEEGMKKMFSGAETAVVRAMLMTVGQLSFYDQIKQVLLRSGRFDDNYGTHILSSLNAGIIATILTQPVDVIKTRFMNSKPDEFPSYLLLIRHTAKHGGIMAFYKGFIPSVVRVAPITVLVFLFFEKLTTHFGYIPQETSKK